MVTYALEARKQALRRQLVPKLRGHVAHAAQRALREKVLLTEAVACGLALRPHDVLPLAVGFDDREVVRLEGVEGCLHRLGLITLVHRREEGRAIGERGGDEQNGLGAAEQRAVDDQAADADVDGQRGQVAP